MDYMVGIIIIIKWTLTTLNYVVKCKDTNMDTLMHVVMVQMLSIATMLFP